MDTSISTNMRRFDDHKPSKPDRRITVIAENFSVSANVGSLFRVSDALGVEKIYLAGNSPTPPNRKIKQAARSTDQYVPYTYEADALDVIRELRSKGYKIISLELTENSEDIRGHGLRPEDKIALVLGSEREGVRQALLQESDAIFHVPMKGANSSMNVVVASAIAIYELTR